MRGTKVNILSTKTLSDKVIADAAKAGIHIECIPFIETVEIKHDELSGKINEIAQDKACVIFTSAKAVKTVAKQLQSAPAWKIFCLFGATKKEVEKYFPDCGIIDESASSADLADEVLKQGIKEVFFFCGNKRMDTIPEKLSGRVELHLIEVYKTIADPQKVETEFNGVLFFSPSAVESYFSVNGPHPGQIFYSIGKTTAMAIEKFTNNKIITAVFPSAESMLTELRNF